MAVTKEKKAEQLQELVDKFGRSKTVVFADYRGLDVKSISDLRGELRKGDAEAKVAKKTLIQLAAKENKITDIPAEAMEGPVAAVFSYEDEMAGIQIVYKFAKGNENLKLLGGIIDGKVVGPDVIKQYAQLPSKEELIAKLIGSMNSPLSGTVGLLGNIVGGFVRVLNAYKDTLPAEEAAPTPAAEEKAEEPKEEKPAEEAPAETEAPAEEPAGDDSAGGDDAAASDDNAGDDAADEGSEEEKKEEPAAEEAEAPAEEEKPADDAPEGEEAA